MLIVQFRASSLDHIISAQCGSDRYCIPPTRPFEMLEAFQQLALHGWYRVSTAWSNLCFDLEGSFRTYKYWSGRPVWITGRLHTFDHPKGWVRHFVVNEFKAHAFIGHGLSRTCLLCKGLTFAWMISVARHWHLVIILCMSELVTGRGFILKGCRYVILKIAFSSPSDLQERAVRWHLTRILRCIFDLDSSGPKLFGEWPPAFEIRLIVEVGMIDYYLNYFCVKKALIIVHQFLKS